MSLDEPTGKFLNHLMPARRLKSHRHEFLAGIGLAALSAILWAFVCLNFSVWPLAFVAMVPALFVIERASSTRRAVLFAWCVGLIGNTCGFYWMIGTIERFVGLSRLTTLFLFLLVCGFHALRLALFGWAVRVIRNHTELPLALVAPLVMVTAEMCVPLIFPYYIAMSLARQPLLIQFADVTGVVGVSALLMMVNGAIYDVMSNSRSRLKIVAASCSILITVLGYGLIRLHQFTQRRALAPKIKVGIVQPNTITFANAGGGSQIEIQRKIADLQARSTELETGGADLILWPESSYPVWVSRQDAGDHSESDSLRIKRGFSAPLVFNATTYDPPLLHSSRPYNSALMLDRESKFTARYDKQNLFVFGEYTPGAEMFPWIEKFSPVSIQEFAAGQDIKTLPFHTGDGREWRLGPMICLEDIVPNFGRQLGALHPHLLVNLTNDSWFGDTSEPWQHLALSVFRSVELRTEMVRAVNTGVSTYVDATGRVYTESYVVDPAKDSRGADKIVAEVALIEGGHTVYALVGDYFGYICIALTLYLSLILPRQRRRQSNRSEPPAIAGGSS